ncbi:hypothetical protein [Blautia sp. 1033sp1_1033st1_G9_1033SCRN_220408]|uniref:hypothetical protein n=1 Tax=Blautia sp. 1033sp1_1033st1_G9_1033SCRN_220408 TaxID=3144490 RepID=UPI0034A2DF0B
MASVLTGCSLTPQKTPKTEASTEVKPVVPQTETQSETAVQTETKALKEASLKDVQVSVEKGGRKGNVELQIEDSTGSKQISENFASSSSAFSSQDSEENGVYMDSDSVLYARDGKWKEIQGDYQDIFNLIYSDECDKKEDTVINDNACYHLSLDSDDNIGALLGYCYMNGYSDIVCGSTHFDFYINRETKQFVRIDVSMPFLATAGDSTDTKGEISGSIIVTDTNADAIVKPETEKEDTKTAASDYKTGEILGDKNAYQNQQFGIQILGQDLFTFDSAKTDELKGSYIDSGSKYQEEAYAYGDGVILNISSIESNGSSTEDIIKQYLSDSAAEEVNAGEQIKLAGNNYATATSIINQTQTKTYGTGVDGQVLIFTLYYTDVATIDSFEKKNIFSTSENPYWEAECWTLEGKYQVTTPKGYSIVKGESGDLYVDMKSSFDELNVFAIENSSIDTEIVNETVTEGNTTREVKGQEDVTLADGSVMKYLMVFNTEPNLTYYTYVGLIQKDTAVIKIYAVSSADNADFKATYTDVANSIFIPEQDTTAEQENSDAQTDAPSETAVMQ